MFVRCSHPNVSSFSASVSATGALFSANVSWADAMFVRRRCDVLESLQLGAPFISLNRFVIDRLSGEGYGAQKSNAPVLTASPVDAVARSVRFHRWGLGFRQSSFRLIMRALQDGTISVF